MNGATSQGEMGGTGSGGRSGRFMEGEGHPCPGEETEQVIVTPGGQTWSVVLFE